MTNYFAALRRLTLYTMIFFLMSCFLTLSGSCSARILNLKKIRLPPGFVINVYADNVPGARSLAMGKNGTVFVGTREEGKVYALLDRNKDKRTDKILIIASGLNMPNGVAFRDGSLYVAEINRILRYDNIEKRLKNPPAPVVVNDGFPTDRHHGWKFIRFGPDGLLYVPVGAPCNICERENPRYATIMRMKPDGTGLEIFARGVRNTVGFDWDPETEELWFTDNGRDWLGDNLPPDELNHAPIKGMNFGFPYCYGNNIPDPEFKDLKKCIGTVPPAMRLGPHVAPLGMLFYSGKQFPAEYRHGIFIAEHGSWNRTAPIGYRITLVTLKNNRAEKYEIFAEGWLRKDKRAWGRPVDLLLMPDGALLVSDDMAGVVYRISYNPAHKVNR
jgi:glucose/arabinose dehydrogenase